MFAMDSFCGKLINGIKKRDTYTSVCCISIGRRCVFLEQVYVKRGKHLGGTSSTRYMRIAVLRVISLSSCIYEQPMTYHEIFEGFDL